VVLSALDPGTCTVGSYHIHYRTKNTRDWWSPWKTGTLNSNVELLLRVNIDVIEFYAVDVLGNTEPVTYYDLPIPG